jgi:transcription termination factor Rho
MSSSQTDDTKTYFEPIPLPEEPKNEDKSTQDTGDITQTRNRASRSERPQTRTRGRKYSFTPNTNSDATSQGSFQPQQPQQQQSQQQDQSYYIPDLAGETLPIRGILDLANEGHGYLRPKFSPSNQDIYISQSQIRRFGLRPGDMVTGVARPPKER